MLKFPLTSRERGGGGGGLLRQGVNREEELKKGFYGIRKSCRVCIEVLSKQERDRDRQMTVKSAFFFFHILLARLTIL